MADIEWDEPAYLDLLHDLIRSKRVRGDENEPQRREKFCHVMRFDLRDGRIPLLTTKKVQWRSLSVELLWFMKGLTNVDFLHSHGVHIWDTWANPEGDVGPIYGKLWREWESDVDLVQDYDVPIEIDQLNNVMRSLRDRPQARSHMMIAWRPDWLDLGSIKPCHVLFQFYRFGNELELAMYQRSCDTFLGVPFNLAQFSLFNHIMAHHLGLTARTLHWIGGDVHLYENHVEQARTQLGRSVLEPPRLRINPKGRRREIDDYEPGDFQITAYANHGALPASISAQGKPGQGVAI